jgi:GT2 family glycosyltransferase
MSAAPRLSIIVPTWNNLDMLKLCLRSIAEHSEVDHEVVLHVNEGSDGTYDWVRRNGIRHTRTTENVGICHAMNLAAQVCSGEYFVYLNDDMYVLPGWDRCLYEYAAETADREPTYVSGTMVQARSIAPSVVLADYGDGPSSFQEQRLLDDFRGGKVSSPDWNGAMWPPSCIHRKWWSLVGGYSIEFTPGFYSDVDFSMKLWQIGCRRFMGSGSSLVYHFGEKTTSQVRGPRKRNVYDARRLFLRKWGILPTTFKRYYLRCGQPYRGPVGEADWRSSWWERLRLLAHKVIPSRRRSMQRAVDAGKAGVAAATVASS